MSDAAWIEALRRPEVWPSPCAEVGFLQTHISLLFFAGDRVYKVKKAVKFPFLDYTSLEARRRYCEEEVSLNRRLAPAGVYRGVVPIRRASSGLAAGGDEGEIVDWAVEMERLPESGMMSRLLDEGRIDNGVLRRLVELLAAFHARAETGPGVDEFGEPEAVRARMEETLAESRSFLPPSIHRHVAARTREFLAVHEDLLRRRVAEGRIRDGHGDLHAGNICLRGEEIVVYDCIEFSPAFRRGDVAADLAFLAMDLDLRGFRGFSSYLAHLYAERTRDPELLGLMEFYKRHRAAIRGAVGCLRALDPALEAAEQERGRAGAMRYFHLAASYGMPPCLMLTCGLPATGKTSAACLLAAPFEAAILRSDVVRKQLQGRARTERWSGGFLEGPYAPEWTARTYDALLAHAGDLLRAGRTVVVDATFPRRAWRDAFRQLARGIGVPFLLVHLSVPEEVVAARMAARARDAAEVSDATLEVYRLAKTAFEPPDEIAPGERLDGPRDDLVTAALERLIASAGR